ncbi:MAG: bifunctional UDP-N-acetylglucosamine diphosphorylase/glucosamine-1-phosphate N-acetyltransferase GlmU, partial [Bdellovibrionales bacterium]|nr:bifunctional UDP-N-acetylglucosamine diphosphorylase/glucosamine-1-phosphate N-acetyltransferase GlmU [Bdellovibrionales bacterium]
MSLDRLTIIILAAGKGTRMKSPLPKVVHPVAGEPMIRRIARISKGIEDAEVRIVVGFGRALVEQIVEPLGATCVVQEKQAGTADAVRVACEAGIEGTVMILNGDHPLIEAHHLYSFLNEYKREEADVAVITCELPEPGQFGRIVRDKWESLQAIVEAKDATPQTLEIKEVNTGIYVLSADAIREFLPQITSLNNQNEYYLTDIIQLAKQAGKKVIGIKSDADVAYGVNSQMELSKANKLIFRKKVEELLDDGVVIIDPDTTYVEPDVEIGSATVLYPGNYIRGNTKIGSFCVIEPNCMIIDSEIHNEVQIKSGSYIEKSEVQSKSSIGPYAHLRPKTKIGEECKVGNFVEMKNTTFANKAKAAHLTYLGDAEVGEETNIGCGTITCNYREDKKKYQTKIGKGVFVGSDTQFVAPVEIGDGAIIGSGSTITKNVPADALAVARGRQFIK